MPETRTWRILNVDDNEGGRYASTRVLKKAGFDVIEAANGTDALTMAATQHPDLVLLDVNLPDIGGFEVCKRLKQDKKTASIPVVHLSATYVHTRERVQGLEGGADGYLVNPIEPEELVATIRSFLRIKNAEMTLRESEEKFRTLAESTPVAIMIYQGDRWVYSNPAGEMMSGYSCKELYTMHYWDFVAPEFQQLVRDNGKERQAGKQLPRTYDFRIIAKDSTEKWVTLTGSQFQFNGEPAGLISVIDITDRKRAEEAVKKREALLNVAQRVAHLGSWDMNVQSGQIIWSDELYRIFGYEPQSFIPQRDSIARIVHPDDLEPLWAASEKAIAEKTPFEFVLRIIRPDGEMRILLDQAETQYDKEGNAVRMVGTALDITDRKRAEKAQRESEARLRTLIDTLPDLVWLKDPEGVYLSCNRRFESFFGAMEKDIIGKTDYDFMDRDQGDFFRHHDKAAIVAGGFTTNEEEITFAIDGHREVLETIKTPVHASDGQLIGVLGIGRNITEHKRASDILALANRKLTLMNDVTYQDIQNKVTALRGYAELMKDVRTEAERASFLGKAEKILADIHQVIRNTKEYQEMGIDQPRWIPLEPSIRMAAALTSHDTAVSIVTDVHGLELYTDPLIGKVFFNLIDNAIKHGTGLSRISFSCHEIPDRLVLVCEDDGAGIDPQKRATLFLRIVADQPRFGLFFVSEYLTLAGMSIAETGEPGKGARFEITVPKGMYRFGGSQ